MNGQLKLQQILHSHWGEIQRLNPEYSLRSFAKRLNLSPGALSGFLRGKRRFSKKIAHKILNSLGESPEVTSEVLSQIKNKSTETLLGIKTAETIKALELSNEEFKAMSSWEHYAFLSLARTRQTVSDLSWVATKLGISETRAKDVIARLEGLGFIKRLPSGRWIRTKAALNFSSKGVVNTALRKAHDETLSLARSALFEIPLEQRDITSLTFPMDLNKLDEARLLIEKFQEELSKLCESGKTTDVYRVAVQLFPLTKIQRERKKEGNKS